MFGWADVIDEFLLIRLLQPLFTLILLFETHLSSYRDAIQNVVAKGDNDMMMFSFIYYGHKKLAQVPRCIVVFLAS